MICQLVKIGRNRYGCTVCERTVSSSRPEGRVPNFPCPKQPAAFVPRIPEEEREAIAKRREESRIAAEERQAKETEAEAKVVLAEIEAAEEEKRLEEKAAAEAEKFAKAAAIKRAKQKEQANQKQIRAEQFQLEPVSEETPPEADTTDPPENVLRRLLR